jgi:hypothetical protein
MDELEPIKRKIYVIRGQRVMLDYDASRCQIGALNLGNSRYAAIQKRREAAGEKLPPPVKKFDKMHTRRRLLRPLLRRTATLCGQLAVCLLLTATLLLMPSCSEDAPQLDPDNLVTTRLAADSSETADVPASFALEVDTAWQDTKYYDFDGNPLPPPGDSTTIAIPDDTPQGDAAGGV